MTKTKKTNDESETSSVRSKSSVYFTPSIARSESSKKTSISDDKLESSVYFPDVANMTGINILKPRNETKTSFEYSDLKEFF